MTDAEVLKRARALVLASLEHAAQAEQPALRAALTGLLYTACDLTFGRVESPLREREDTEHGAGTRHAP